MNKEATILIMGEPQGKGRPRFRRMGAFSQPYTPDQTVLYENLIKSIYQQTNQPRFDDADDIEVRICAYYTIPQSASKKKKVAMQDGIVRPRKKPDGDNIMKIVCDSLNGVAYRDDAQIVDQSVRRFYDEFPRVEVFLRKIDEPQHKPSDTLYRAGLQ